MTRHQRGRAVTAALLLLSGAAATVSAQCPPIGELTTSNSRSSSYGTAVAVSGERAVVGDSFASDVAGAQGAVYLWDYDGQTWTESARLIAPDGASGDRFGDQVALDGVVLAVAAVEDDDAGSSSGTIYMFRFDGTNWNLEAQLHSPNPSFRYGTSLAVSQGVLAVENSKSASVDVWRYQGGFLGWQYEQTFTGPTFFGTDLDVSGDRLAIGSSNESLGGVQSGVVHVYDYDGVQWQHHSTLQGSQSATGSSFGANVGMDGDRIAAGAPREGVNGVVYVYEYDGTNWIETFRHEPLDGTPTYGSVVDLDGDSVVALGGSPGFTFYELRRAHGAWWEATQYSGADNIAFAAAVDAGHAIIGSHSDRALEFPAKQLRLLVNDSTPDPNQVIELRTTAAPPNHPVLMYAISVNGVPTFVHLLTFKFGGDYSFRLQQTVPPGLSGIDLGLISFALGVGGVAQASNPLVLDFQ